jgi:amylosucrase
MESQTSHEPTNAFEARLALKSVELKRLFKSLYGDEGFDKLSATLLRSWNQRPSFMKALDTERLTDQFWYQKSSMIGMMLYVDNFAGTFADMPKKLPYVEELGISYIHLMPICKMPAIHNDGGYAVSDFTKIDARFGTDAEFDTFAKACHAKKISLCFDFVLNHTSDEHVWAQGAREGDPSCKARYFIFPDRKLPDAYERTVNEVFPVLAPGNFTFDSVQNAWVLTTFNKFQWDLNYANPDVLIDMIEFMLSMANRGIDIFRFDAIPYIWKEWGTSCRNLPQVHSLVRMFRLALEICAPATIIKGEVVMAPKEVAPYFGTENAPECHLLYNVSFMVQLWNALATRDARMLSASIASIPNWVPRDAAWVNYARCHDDIGWGLDEEVLRGLGFDPFLHKRFLISFYNGDFSGSFSKGALYESDPKTLDARNCGTCASLCGLEKSLEEHDEYQQELAVKRILLLHSLCIMMNGIPVIYSGDEIAQLNDYTYLQDVRKAHDSRFLHRGAFNWKTVEKMKGFSSPEAFVYNRITRMIQVRKSEPLLGSGNQQEILEIQDIGVLGIILQPRDAHPMEDVLILVANCTEHQKQVHITHPSFIRSGIIWHDLLQGKHVPLFNAPVLLGPYELLILKRKIINE